MKWSQIIMVIVGIVTVAIAVRLRPEKPVTAPPPVTPAPAAEVAGRILSPSTEHPGVVSRLVGLLRTYVAVPEEVRLESLADAAGGRAASVPILIVFENETYRPLPATDVGWIGRSLCTVSVARIPDKGAELEVFQTDVPLPARADWLSAERRSVSVDWPLRDHDGDIGSGLYKISVRLALPDEPTVEIYTRLL